MNRELALLINIQNLELQLRDAEDPEKAQQLRDMGMPLDPEKIRRTIEELLAQVDERQRRYYLRLRERYDNPVVSVWEGHCTGCFANVPTGFDSASNRDKVKICETCGRILFQP